MKLYGYFRSSSSYRVRIALALKGLSYEYAAVHLLKDGGEQHLPAFLQKNPMAQVPVLEVDGLHLSQSVAILEYIEERYPDPPLLPKDLVARARVRAAVEVVNSGIQPMQNLSLMNEIKRMGGDGHAFAKAANERGLVALEEMATAHGGQRLVGDETSLADVCLVPQMYSARRFGVDLAPFPRLVAIDAALTALPAFAAAHPDRQPDAPSA
jgi:maleylpyruvate isomerase